MPTECMSTNRRIAAVQHGDYVDALRIVGSGEPEPYYAMRYSVEVLEHLWKQEPHLVVNLNAPRYIEQRGDARLVGLPLRRLPRPLPGLLGMRAWARAIRGELEAFKPTHVLLRTGISVLAVEVLEYATRRNLSTLVILASRLAKPSGLLGGRYQRRFVRLLNHACVQRVGNHRWPATQSLIDYGVTRDKVVAWDWPTTRRPEDFPTKRLACGRTAEVLYAGAVAEVKGVGDIIRAVALLQQRGVAVSLTVIGDGADLARMKKLTNDLACREVVFTGRLSNDEVFERMRASTLVCVPSRHEFNEGMPMTLTEALASRTPVVASDHPVMTAAFRDGEGVRFARAGDSRAFASTMRGILDSTESYAALSASTAAAFKRVECGTLFGDMIQGWIPLARQT